jgi:hypothetical protein
VASAPGKGLITLEANDPILHPGFHTKSAVRIEAATPIAMSFFLVVIKRD